MDKIEIVTPRYIVADVETGGLNVKKNPLLTAYFLITDENWNKIDDLSLAILPYGPYTVFEDSAMKVNKIDRSEHLKISVEHHIAGKQLEEFLKKHKHGNNKLTPLFQNGQFDFGFIFEHLISNDDWQKFCGRGYLDTKRFMDILVDFGMYPADSTSLEKAVKYLEIEKGDHHTANGDVIMTILVYRRLKEMFCKSVYDSPNQNSFDLLELVE